MEENVKIEDIRESSVEGLVKRLIEVKYIKPSEEDTFRDSLKQAINALDDNEKIPQFMLALSEEIRESPTEIFTSTGINVAYLKEVLESVTKTVEMTSQVQTVIQEEPVLTNTEKTEAELQAEKEARIEENKEMLSDICGNLFGIKFDEKEKDEIARFAEEYDRYCEVRDTIRKKHPNATNEEIDSMAEAEMGVEKGYFSNEKPIVRIVASTKLTKKVLEANEKNNGDKNASTQTTVKQNADLVRDTGQEKEINKAAQEGKFKVDILRKSTAIEVDNYRLQKSLDDEKEAQIVIDSYEKNIDVTKLRDNIKKIQDLKKISSRLKRKSTEKLGFQMNNKLKELLDKEKERYIATGISVSDIFEEIKDEDVAEGIEFEEVLDYMLNGLNKYLPVTESSGHSNILTMKELEKDIRVISLTINIYEQRKTKSDASDEFKVVRSRNARYISELKKELEAKQNSIQKMKNQIVESKGIDTSKYREEEGKRTKKTKDEQSQIPSEVAIKDKNRISRDRNEIIKLTKSEGISMSEATQRYFEENPGRIKKYSIEEQEILLGTQNIGNDAKRKNGISKLWKNMLRGRYTQTITSLENEIKEYQWVRDAAITSDIVDTRLSEILKKIAQKERNLAKAKRNDAKLDTNNGKNDIESVMKQKEKEATLEIAFRKYFESGMTVDELLDDMQKNGNAENIDKYDILEEINQKGTRYISQTKVEELIENEQRISDFKLEIKALEILKENAKLQGRIDLIESHKEKIENIRNSIEEIKRSMETTKATVARKIGYWTEIEAQQQEGSEIEGSEVKIQSTESVPQAEITAPWLSTTSIKAETIEVADDNSQGQIIDVAKVAKKGKTQMSDVKEAASGIKDIKTIKAKSAEQTTDNKSAPTPQETSDDERTE